MCHYVTSKDVYTSCLLWKAASEEASAERAVGSTPGPSHLTRLLRLLPINTRSTNTPVAASPRPDDAVASEELPVEEELACHVIQQTTYFQCAEARDDTTLSDDVDKRHCPGPNPTQMVEGAPVEEERTSKYRNRPCPVCVAARTAVEKELNAIVVVSISRFKALNVR
jgi:hypothetical protein